MKIHQSTVLDIQAQTLTLIKSSIALAKQIHDNCDIHAENGLLDVDSLNSAMSTLENEHQKAAELEMVIAVVGTMKAGKSTTINAIVGQEILPNRNYPMTALPTVVTHVRGQKVPALLFENNSPITELSKDLAAKIIQLDDQTKKDMDFLHHTEVQSLISHLKKYGVFEPQKRYEGQKEIFEFLKNLNDLLRLAKELSVEPPYDSFRLINELPVIEVEFQHLNGTEQYSHGKLSIMDTPGPNEFGQSEKLKDIFKDQLSKASAVLLIADYTQMNSDAGGAVKSEVLSVLGSLDDRLFVMLNKFDAKGKNDTSREDTVSFFCNQLMDGKVKPENVFPVSAQRSFLANRVLSELSDNDAIDQTQGWVEEFGRIAFGEDWEEDIEDVEDVVKKANKIWDKAGFKIPLEKVILEANSNAATISLHSALTKLLEINSQIGGGISGFKEAIGSKIEKLQSVIDSIEKDRSTIYSIQKDTEQLVENHSKDLENIIQNLSKEVEDEVFKATQDLFNHEQTKQFEKEQRELEENEKNSKKSLFTETRNLFFKDKNNERNLDDLLEAGEIKFERYEEDKAEDLLKSINKSLQYILESATKSTQEKLIIKIKNSEQEINNSVLGKLKKTIEKANKNLEGNGFSLTLSIGELHSFSTDIAIHNISTKASVSQESRRYSRVTNKFTNFFNDDWGRESYYSDVDIYLINIDSVKDMASRAVSETMENMQKITTDFLNKQVQPNIDQHLVNISQFLEKYRQTLLSGMEARQKSQQEKRELIEALRLYECEVNHIMEDTSDSKEELTVAVRGV